VAGGAIVVRDGILWKFYTLCFVGGLLALIGIALLVTGTRAARAAKLFRTDQREESPKPSTTEARRLSRPPIRAQLEMECDDARAAEPRDIQCMPRRGG